MVTTVIDQSRLEAFMGQVVVDLAASFSATRVRLGARLGLYRALAEGGSATPGELAERTGTESRMVREWLGNQPAGGYVTYDTASERYTLPPEQAAALADDKSDLYLLGACDILASLFADEDRLGRLASGLAGVVEKLEAGARVADVGCGHGASTIIMPRPSPPRRSWASTRVRAGSSPPAWPPPRRGSRIACSSRWPRVAKKSPEGQTRGPAAR